MIIDKLKKKFYLHRCQKVAKSCGNGFKVNGESYVTPNTTLGNNVNFNGMKIQGSGSVIIGDNFHSGIECMIITSIHNYDNGNAIPYDNTVISKDVIIEDNVEVGANTCIDRATMGATIIRKGVKLDNLIQVAHNVEVGSNTVMASQCGIAGSTKIGEWCMFGGQVGVAGHSKMGDRLNVGAQTGIPGNMKGNQTVMGSPAIDAKLFARSSVVSKRLPEMYQTLNALQKEVEELKKLLNKNE